MSIDRQLLWQRLERFIDSSYKTDSADFEKYLAKTIIFNEPTQNCILRSPKTEWDLLPKDKSMFTAQSGCGLPIGNLTSQVFANFYLTPFDHYIKHTIGCKRYVRYVDDCIFISDSIEALKAIIQPATSFWERELYLKLHPKKIYLQNAQHGVPFLGTFIKPLYTVSSRRVKNNFVETLKKYAGSAEDHVLTREEKTQCRARINSYLGIMAHYKTYHFRKEQLLYHFQNHLKKHFFVLPDAKKISVRQG